MDHLSLPGFFFCGKPRSLCLIEFVMNRSHGEPKKDKKSLADIQNQTEVAVSSINYFTKAMRQKGEVTTREKAAARCERPVERKVLRKTQRGQDMLSSAV